jgi:hypothetical protein
MTSSSSQNGKAFEYLSCKALLQLPGATATARAINKQDRDSETLISLKHSDRQYMAFASQFIADFVRNQIVGELEVDRPDDNAGEDGDPSDLTVKTQSQYLRLSLKNANSSIKHQRPSALYRHLGFANGTPEADHWESAYKMAISDFFDSRHQGLHTLRSEEVDSESLYILINGEAVTYINEMSVRSATASSSLYDFLVGPEDLIVAKASSKEITLSKWNFDRGPDQVFAYLDGDGVNLDFSNGHSLHLRLHTADSTINVSHPSLKWDTRSNSPISLVSRKTF